MNRRVIVMAAALVAIVAVAGWWLSRQGRVPQPGSAAYEQLTSAFYHGLASLEIGLLETARTAFTQATEVAPEEPAAWANLGVTHLRRADFDLAAEALDRAVELAPDNSAIAGIYAGLNVARGRPDEAVADYRRASDLNPDDLRARFALAELLERQGGTGSAAQMEDLLSRAPDNLAVIVERARLAARAGDRERLADSVRRLQSLDDGWPGPAAEQLNALAMASAAGDMAASTRAIAFLRNVLARVPRFREDLAAVRVPVELLAEAMTGFVRVPAPTAEPAPADAALRYATEPLDDRAASALLVTTLDGLQQPSVLITDGTALRRVNGGGEWPARGARALTALDWNHDFRMDIVASGPSGSQLLLQDEAGQFADASAQAGLPGGPVDAAWPADVDMDGDLDLLIGRPRATPAVLRNNGDGTSRPLELFAGVIGVRGFAWADVDVDGDPDAAFLDEEGSVHVFANDQSGAFRMLPVVPGAAVALAAADLDADGQFELIVVTPDGAIAGVTLRDGAWERASLVDWTDAPPPGGDTRLFVADLDNNGALDIVASSGGRAAMWLGAGGGRFDALAPIGMDVFGAAELTGDGLLDLVGITSGRAVRLVASGTQRYHWQLIRPRAQMAAGDQRINSFGVGGEISVRSGLLVQRQLLTGAPIHVGLGTRTAVDVARIIWPNGVMQAEFDLRADEAVVAEQRLKGSCPWVFAYDGEGMAFITDFLWRSPLGLRINAQDTAGVTQTEDWVRIAGNQLAPRDGAYDIRITAELWESHFFDHVALLAVDHPAGSEMFVDERFSAAAPPALEAHVFAQPRPIAAAHSGRGEDLTVLLAARDGRHAAGFDRGAYQGLAGDHALAFDLGADVPAEGPLWIVAQGWIYPTDSSINVAIAQGTHPAPRGLALEVEAADGSWRTLHPDLGFPAGKNKTILIDISARPEGARRFRLRTNLEIYWDAIAWATPAPGAVRRTRLLPDRAELRYRGFSQTTEDRSAHAPETPDYDRLANVTPRWRDLIGYHTRFGDVRELLLGVDDRYVIMNAGDELQVRFAALPPPAAGHVRDFVLIGDGWEKDGDFNTAYSQTVLPLPRHGVAHYVATSLELEADPVFRAYPEDWQRYHTRFVAPDRYLRGLSVAGEKKKE